MWSSGRKKRYVCHESTIEETLSTLGKYSLGETRMRFRCDGPCVRYYNLSRDLEVRASPAVSRETGSLRG